MDAELDTLYGTARAQVHAAERPRAALVLGHGAGGGVTARDLVAATEAAHEESYTVVLVEQPYRVAGRRSAPPAHQLDAAWVSVIVQLRERELHGLPLVVGGRSSGARVACRTAGSVGAAAVLCLAFPLLPPKGRPTRLPELDEVNVPTLVVQGTRDHFGMPPERPGRIVAQVAADHSLRTDLDAVRDAVRSWLHDLQGDSMPTSFATA